MNVDRYAFADPASPVTPVGIEVTECQQFVLVLNFQGELLRLDVARRQGHAV